MVQSWKCIYEYSIFSEKSSKFENLSNYDFENIN